MAAVAKEWSVGLEAQTPGPGIEADRIYGLIEALEDHHPGAASVSSTGMRIGVHLWVQAPDVRRALAVGEKALLDALARLGLEGFALVAAELKPWQELEADLDRSNTPDLVGVAELAEILRVSRQRVSELAATSQFPRPLAALKAGPVWERSSIGHFVDTWRRTPGRPPGRKAAGEALGGRGIGRGGEAADEQARTADIGRAAGKGRVPQGLARPRRAPDGQGD